MIGVIADDITGSNDIGSMFVQSDLLTHIYSYEGRGSFSRNYQGEPQVVILDTDSRIDSAEEAYKKEYAATKELKKAGVEYFYNKTCSAFRGNIGAYLDGMLDALAEEFAVVVVGFPKNGRTTVDGIHYIYGTRLEDSEFKNDPIHPMTESSLVKILQGQTERKVDLINYEIVKKGSEILKNKIEEKKNKCNYLIIDVTQQKDLEIIARACKAEKVVGGSSALAEELSKVWPTEDRSELNKISKFKNRDKGVLIACGSLMPQTAAQINYMKEKDNSVVEMDTLKIFDKKTRKKQIDKLCTEIIEDINKGKDVVLHSSNTTEKVKLTKSKGKKIGLKEKEVSRLVSATLSEVVEKVLRETGQKKLIIAGGDTSAAICKKLNIKSFRVWQVIEPGLPSCISLTEPSYFLVLKSGSFGGDNFFEKSIEHLQNPI